MIIFRGGSALSEVFTVKDNQGVAVDITADTLTFYLKSSLLDADASALLTIALTITAPTLGQATLAISQVGIANLSDRYYPYIIKRVSGTTTSLVDTGVLNVNQIYNPWEWDTDVLEGISLSSIVSQANTLLRYRDWDTTELISWTNDAVLDWCKRTNYLVARATRTTVKDQTIYELPKDIITIRNVFINGNEMFRNRGWKRENNSLLLDNGTEGDKTIELICSKYAQQMDNVNQYAEVVQEAFQGIIYYVCWKAKLEDREFTEADYYMNLYQDYVNDYTLKNTIDSTEETQLTYVGQGTSLGINDLGF